MHIVGLVLFTILSGAGYLHAYDPSDFRRPSQSPLYELKDIGTENSLGTSLDLDITVTDQEGKTWPLSHYFAGTTPVMISPVYYKCPMLCNLHLNGVLKSFKNMEWIPGNQFRHLAISFQPDETPVIAKEKHNAYLRELGKNVENEGWVFLTASPQNITKLMNQLGFRYRWDEKTKQYAHASAIYVLSPKGMITRILPGVDFPPRDIKLALLEATRGEVGDFVDRFALFCFQYDPTKNTYTLYAINLMRMFAGLTLLLVGGYLFYFWSKISMNQSKQGVN